MRRAISRFLTGALVAVAMAMALVVLSPGDTDAFAPYRLGWGVLTVYERTVGQHVDTAGHAQVVATTSMKPGVLLWGLMGGALFLCAGTLPWRRHAPDR